MHSKSNKMLTLVHKSDQIFSPPVYYAQESNFLPALAPLGIVKHIFYWGHFFLTSIEYLLNRHCINYYCLLNVNHKRALQLMSHRSQTETVFQHLTFSCSYPRMKGYKEQKHVQTWNSFKRRLKTCMLVKNNHLSFIPLI